MKERERRDPGWNCTRGRTEEGERRAGGAERKDTF